MSLGPIGSIDGVSARADDGDAGPIATGRDRWRRVHAMAGRRSVKRSVFTVNLAAMIDVIFLLLMYFLLSMDFTPDESALSAALAGESAAVEPDDPFALPVQPIVISVRTTAPIVEASREDAEPRRVASAGAFVVSTDSPLLEGLSRSAGDASPAATLRARLEGLSGGVLAVDQPLVVDPSPETAWEHALTVYNAVLEAGFTRVRFARPEGG